MQQTESNAGREFPPNRSRKTLIFLYIFCWLFITTGALVALGSSVDEKVEWEPFGIGVGIFGFGLFIFILGKYFTSARKISYIVRADGISLKSTRGAVGISYFELDTVTALKEKQAEEFMLKLRQKLEDKNTAIIRGETGAQSITDKLKEAFREQKKSFEPYKFLSVPIMYINAGRKHRNKTTRVNIPCDTVFILLKNGDGYLISPLNPEEFVNEVKKYLPPT